jgi:hypothetical protein
MSTVDSYPLCSFLSLAAGGSLAKHSLFFSTARQYYFPNLDLDYSRCILDYSHRVVTVFHQAKAALHNFARGKDSLPGVDDVEVMIEIALRRHVETDH